jgi:hypothetical protein
MIGKAIFRVFLDAKGEFVPDQEPASREGMAEGVNEWPILNREIQIPSLEQEVLCHIEKHKKG